MSSSLRSPLPQESFSLPAKQNASSSPEPDFILGGAITPSEAIACDDLLQEPAIAEVDMLLPTTEIDAIIDTIDIDAIDIDTADINRGDRRTDARKNLAAIERRYPESIAS